jgi:hypothetical protein
MVDKKELLICIAFHYTDFTYPFVCKVLKNIQETYKCSYHVVVHTSQQAAAELLNTSFKNIEVIVAENKGYNLTWEHRGYMAKYIHDYENCMYLEDDIIIPYETYLRYIENFWTLWPEAVPGLLRYEEVNGIKFFNELNEPIWTTWVVAKENKTFAYWSRPYTAAWILPTKILKPCIDLLGNDFTTNTNTSCFAYLNNGTKKEHHLIRENAASFTNWQLGKPTYVELDKAPTVGIPVDIPATSICAHSSNKYYGVLKKTPGEPSDNIKYVKAVKSNEHDPYKGISVGDRIRLI